MTNQPNIKKNRQLLLHRLHMCNLHNANSFTQLHLLQKDKYSKTERQLSLPASCKHKKLLLKVGPTVW